MIEKQASFAYSAKPGYFLRNCSDIFKELSKLVKAFFVSPRAE